MRTRAIARPRRRFAIALLLAGLPAARALPGSDRLDPDDRRRFAARACTLCEAAAARMRIARMYYGADGVDAGAPRSATL